MASRKADPLLGAARVVLLTMMVLAVLIAGALTLAVPAVLLFPSPIIALLASHGAGWVSPPMLRWLALAMALTILISLTALRGQQLLLRLVDSVGLGDPFIPENAERLWQMAWLTVGVHLLLVPLDAVMAVLRAASGDGRAGGSVSLGGILLMLLLFILARVFRQGAAMREELEGTV